MFTAEFDKLSFPGAIDTVDGVHFSWERWLHNVYHIRREKERYPSRLWKDLVVHMAEAFTFLLLSVVKEMIKILPYHDYCMQEPRKDTRCKYLKYSLPGKECDIEVRGLYYNYSDTDDHNCRCLQFHVTVAFLEALRWWSKKLESVRKVTETLFGTLKNEFRCLKTFSLHEMPEIWMAGFLFAACCTTCC